MYLTYEYFKYNHAPKVDTHSQFLITRIINLEIFKILKVNPSSMCTVQFQIVIEQPFIFIVSQEYIILFK